ncbi:MAG: hypothetical protein JNL38_31735 [Myxococcales bacterium]|jgi:hypothetical protein|nr:hypothetical protein [Myxococcales bacterium]
MVRPSRIGIGLVMAAAWLAAPCARAEDAPVAVAPRPVDAPGAERAWAAERPGYLRIIGTAMVGDGLRFNNPYRLSTPLGGDAEGVSRTAAYGDVGFGAALGRARGIQHAVLVRNVFALEGVTQVMITPSYALSRRWGALAAYGRAGIPVVLRPDLNVGAELAAGGVFYIRGGIGLAAELVGDLFYGAGTREVSRPVYPLLGAQAGIEIDFEVLP